MPESSLPAELADLPRPGLATRLVAVAEDNTRLREVNARLREVVEAQAVQLEVLKGQQQTLSRRVEELERKAGKDSSNSGKPPSSDPVWDKKSAGKKDTRRSLRERGARSPGKQPGAGSSTLRLVDDPDETIWCPPRSCEGCGGDLSGEPVTAERRHQVTDIAPAPAPVVTEYRAQAKCCQGAGQPASGNCPGT